MTGSDMEGAELRSLSGEGVWKVAVGRKRQSGSCRNGFSLSVPLESRSGRLKIRDRRLRMEVIHGRVEGVRDGEFCFTKQKRFIKNLAPCFGVEGFQSSTMVSEFEMEIRQ
ncbi:hypothetical protein U1Q18_022246 [Sarracenia purpurea var. burkii]